MSGTRVNAPTVALATLGCKVNQFESAAISSDFEAAGCRLCSFTSTADVYVINSCAVTRRAAEESRRLIRRALRRSPASLVVVTGCYAQADPAAVRAIDPGVVLLGNASKHLLAGTALDVLRRQAAAAPASVRAAADETVLDPGACAPARVGDAGLLTREPGDIRLQRGPCPLTVRRFPGRSRAFLKVQDGCDNCCSYCIVPSVRGRSRSVPLADVLRQAELLVTAGYRELVVTGVNVGKYGRDLPERPDIVLLLEQLCRKFVPTRIRLSSIEPPELDQRLLTLATTQINFMPHFHLPLQSGDEGVLRRMRRRYGGREFADVVLRCQAMLPDAALGVDVLVGFPGEDQAAFACTRELLAGLPLAFFHVFPYSSRPGTAAAVMPDQVPPMLREERAAELRALGATLRQRFLESQRGRIRPVLLESSAPGKGLLRGHSDNYLPVTVAAPVRLLGQVVEVVLEEPDGNGGMLGQLYAADSAWGRSALSSDPLSQDS